MPAIVGAHHTSFTVANLARSLEFFHDLLGLEVIGTREVSVAYLGRIVGLPGCRVKAALLRIPGSTHHLEVFEYLTPAGQPYQPRPCDPGSAHLALLVDDLAALYERLRAAGVECVSEPVRIDAGPNTGAWALYLRDPNGILIELFQPPPQAIP
jgi:catechol 2,3-dioxygenase-like lactoylglutathione lyase family enzyme